MTPTIMIQLALELCVACFALICLIFTFCTRKDEPQRSKYIMILLSLGLLILISDSCAWYYRGKSGILAFFLVRITNLLVFACYPFMFLFVIRYLYHMIRFHEGQASLQAVRVLDIICYLHLGCILLSQFVGFLYYFDESNLYHRGNGYFIVSFLGMIELLYLIYRILLQWRCLSRYELLALLLFVILPFFTNLIQFFNYGISLTEITSSLCMILFFMFHEAEKSKRLLGQMQQLESQKQAIIEREMALAEHEIALDVQQDRLAKKESALNFAHAVSEYYKTQLDEKENELVQANVQISISQMQPHFVFNALGSIEQLCRINPAKAAEATHYFARYLRNNLIALNSYELKDFQEELSHIQAYIWLEKMRFGDDLCYEEEILCNDFQVPVLSVQPLVENAVKHGMMGIEEGVLKVKLRSWEDRTARLIQITDNGCGFDPHDLPNDSRVHVGLMNVQSRIRHMCGGILLVKSSIGQGSTFTIVLPKFPMAEGDLREKYKHFMTIRKESPKNGN